MDLEVVTCSYCNSKFVKIHLAVLELFRKAGRVGGGGGPITAENTPSKMGNNAECKNSEAFTELFALDSQLLAYVKRQN